MAPTNRGRMSGLDVGDLIAPHSREDDGEAIAVIGKRTVLNSQNIAPNQFTVQSTQLISARVPIPRQWVITLAQATPQGAMQQPWLAAFDGGVVAPVAFGQAGATSSAPLMPATRGQSDNALQVALRWGAGGIAFETLFDYPAAGVAFGVTADVLDLNVALRANLTTVYASADLIPVVGAFAVPGVEAEATPLRWAETPRTLATVTSAYYAVKPYARRVRLAVPNAADADVWKLFFRDANGAIMWQYTLAASGGQGINATVDVPTAAVYVEVDNTSANLRNMYVEWQIGLT